MHIKNKQHFNLSQYKKGRKVYEMKDSLITDDCVEVKPEIVLKCLILEKRIFDNKGRFCGFTDEKNRFEISEIDYSTDLFHDKNDNFLLYNNPKKSYYKKKKNTVPSV